VQNNPLTRLSSDYGSKIIQKIKSKFTDEDQQLFVANFYCYLNCNQKTDFVINLDRIWKWLGYNRINDCHRVLLKNFKENQDYKIEKAALQDGKAGPKLSEEGKNLGGSGLNREYITLTVNCFKKLCLKSRTEKADQIHDYYIELEEMMNELVAEQAKELSQKLLIKDKQIIQKEYNLYINFSKKPILYIAYTEEDVIKFGYTDDIETRIKDHKREIRSDFNFEYIYESVYNREIERRIKNHDILSKRKIEKIYKSKNQTELIQLDQIFTIKDLDSIIKQIKIQVESEEYDKDKNSEINKLKLEIIEKDNLIKRLSEIPDKINFCDKYIYIEVKSTDKNSYKIISSENENKNPRTMFMYKSDNTPYIMRLLVTISDTLTKWTMIEYFKIKQILDFCILLYDEFNIKENNDNLLNLISRYNSTTHSNKKRINLDNDLFKEYTNSELIVGSEHKVTCGMLCESFYNWYKSKFELNSDNDLSHIKSLQGNWNISFRDQFMKSLQEITGCEYESAKINVIDKTRGLNFTKCSGFNGFTLKNIPNIIYYESDIYIKYIKEFINVTNNQKHKVSRKEILEHFKNWAILNNIFNPKSYGKIFAATFITELITNIEKITKLKLDPKKTKQRNIGIFIGMSHCEFDCVMNKT
jgi:phage anti-repressor protein